MRLLGLASIALGFTGLVLAASKASAGEPAALRVFFMGNSFHRPASQRMAALAKAAGIKEYQTAGVQFLGGSVVEAHWRFPDEKNEAKKRLREGDVDILTLVPFAPMPDAGIEKFVELGLKHKPKMRFIIQHCWPQYESFKKRIKSVEDRNQTDLKALRAEVSEWREGIEAVARDLNKKHGREVVTVVPVGEAVMALRERIAAGSVPGLTKQTDLFRDAQGHGGAPIDLLVAYCNFACITGRSPVGLKFNEPNVSSELNGLLQHLAWDTVTAFPMSGVRKK